MNGELQANLRRLGWRALCAAPFLAGGFTMLMLGLGTAFYGAALLVLGAMIIAFPLAELCARPIMSLYFPTDASPATGNFSIPAARIKQGRYAEAMMEYEKIITAHPQELRAYIGMIEVACQHLRDQVQADKVYTLGMRTLRDKQSQAALHRTYTAQRSLREHPPH